MNMIKNLRLHLVRAKIALNEHHPLDRFHKRQIHTEDTCPNPNPKSTTRDRMLYILYMSYPYIKKSKKEKEIAGKKERACGLWPLIIIITGATYCAVNLYAVTVGLEVLSKKGCAGVITSASVRYWLAFVETSATRCLQSAQMTLAEGASLCISVARACIKCTVDETLIIKLHSGRNSPLSLCLQNDSKR
ncbi:hypothetical protein FGO68_gene11725 [Halteria grandinella]|uniref:Uncharacterized protein n=1 Tax=Halteria grandinella TaxID=5974 RepID=A0A8J8NBH8_HALGN|nr:hypothetical protein FGO68_gene11725 [Halteria grandinella]